MSATGIDEKQEDDDISDADAQQVADEDNDSDDLQDDEDDATVEEALAAAIEDRCVLGVRRSARLQGNESCAAITSPRNCRTRY